MPGSTLLPTTARALTRRLAVEQAEYRVPSLVAAVVRDGELAWWDARGRVDSAARPDTDTQYRIGSITKTMVGTVVLRLRDEGKLDLSDPLERHIPGTPLGDRTIAQLLAHTAGVRAESTGDWWERTPGGHWNELAASLDGEAVLHRAGRRHHYSNVGYAALGELVARLRGQSWFDAVRAEVLAPLGMDRTTPSAVAPHATGWAVHPWADVVLPEPAHDHGAMGAAGQLWSTVDDLARWTAFLAGETDPVLSKDTWEEMREPATVIDGDEWVNGYGLGVQLCRHDGRRLVGHGGAMPGFIATVWADPADRTGVLFLSNTTYGGIRGRLDLAMLDILAEHEPSMPEEWLPAESADPALLALTGPWYWGSASIALHLRADSWLELKALAHGGRTSRFRPEGEDTWIGLDGYYTGERLRAVRGPDGTVDHLELISYVFTREPYSPAAPIPGGVDSGGWRGR
ncbi:CubicO group peptidase (beta-lactamase class C family) [Nocardia tenerifensis]|uniref:CubicO group peptidase (Beta-lactamase class C family) n=1 Tax=Nocardia tenerifensis TaxID=228006 RepID=A0A318JQ37_9NOCA|nr:serine hydrolase domain-containing protein [Nocardia tenerifensis]PXX57835.1 CubicO group peptidase (beta-lactamase class C family) [Nocardia tenerifensis]